MLRKCHKYEQEFHADFSWLTDEMILSKQIFNPPFNYLDADKLFMLNWNIPDILETYILQSGFP